MVNLGLGEYRKFTFPMGLVVGYVTYHLMRRNNPTLKDTDPIVITVTIATAMLISGILWFITEDEIGGLGFTRDVHPRRIFLFISMVIYFVSVFYFDTEWDSPWHLVRVPMFLAPIIIAWFYKKYKERNGFQKWLEGIEEEMKGSRMEGKGKKFLLELEGYHIGKMSKEKIKRALQEIYERSKKPQILI